MKRRILLVEDNNDARTLFTLILEMEGYEVIAFEDGQIAYEQFRPHSPDLLITDLSLPKMDGFALIQAIRKEEGFSQLPVILITAYGMGRLKNLRPLGVNCVLEKPLDPTVLTETVQGIFQQ